MPVGTSGSPLLIIVSPPSLAGTRIDVTNYGRPASCRLTEGSRCLQLQLRGRITRHSDIGLGFLRRRCSWPEVASGEASQPGDASGIVISSRSEERRVGKERRS